MGISAVTALGPHLIGAPGETQPDAALEYPPTRSLSKGFFADISSDANGYSFHRFQMVLWNLLLGIIFVSSVYGNLAMPKFSGSLLVLMGTSAGTYLGFELRGKRSTSEDFRVEKENDAAL